MSTLKANNQTQATKELQAIDEKLLDSVNFEIKEADAKNYHVALVRISERPGQVKNKVTVTTHQYNERSYPKLKKQVAFLGYAHAVLLHDPKAVVETPEPITLKGDPEFDIEKATIKQLKDFADANKIDLKEAKLLDELKAVVGAWLNIWTNEQK